MAVRYVPIDNELVSSEWSVVLHDMRAAGVQFNVNEGHRTLARQAYFYALYRSGRGPIAAVPSGNAPHIRTGRIDHAIDFSNDRAVFAWLASKGLHPVRTVLWPNGTVREPWHIEVSASALASYARSRGHVRPTDKTVKRGMKGPTIIKLRRLAYRKGIRKAGILTNPFFSKNLESAIKRFQHKHGLRADGVVGPATWKALRK